MVASVKDGWVRESPKVLAVGATATYAIDFSAVGSPTGTPTVKAYDATGADKTSEVLSGSVVVNGAVVTLSKFTPASEQVYRIVCMASIGNDLVPGIVEVAVFAVTHVLTSPSTGSYGTLAGVAALTPKQANRSGLFDDTTRPTLTQTVAMIDQIGAVLNSMLAANGFTVPVTDADAIPALRLFVEQEVAAMVEGINGSGRFGPTVEGRRAGRKSRFQIILDDIALFIAEYKIGLERMGASRPSSIGTEIGYRDTDQSGQDVPPLFSRKAFGETYRDWDL